MTHNLSQFRGKRALVCGIPMDAKLKRVRPLGEPPEVQETLNGMPVTRLADTAYAVVRCETCGATEANARRVVHTAECPCGPSNPLYRRVVIFVSTKKAEKAFDFARRLWWLNPAMIVMFDRDDGSAGEPTAESVRSEFDRVMGTDLAKSNGAAVVYAEGYGRVDSAIRCARRAGVPVLRVRRDGSIEVVGG